MNYVYALFFDYWFYISFVGFTSGCLMIGYGWKYQAHYEYMHQIVFAGIFLLIMVSLLSSIKLDNCIIQTPQRTYFYLFDYQGKNKAVAFCFQRFNAQHGLMYADFMQKCLNDDWAREQYNQLSK